MCSEDLDGITDHDARDFIAAQHDFARHFRFFVFVEDQGDMTTLAQVLDGFFANIDNAVFPVCDNDLITDFYTG